MVLILSNKEDAHPSPVIDILHREGVPFFRLNTESLLSDYEFVWWSHSDGMDFCVKNIHTNLQIKGSEISAVWERRPETPADLFLPSSPKINKHNLSEALGFLSFLRHYIKDIPSIGSIVNDRVAASKMLQLKIAKQVGLTTPDTCFSNRKKDIATFAENYPYIIIKSIENDFIWDEENDQEYVFYAQKIASSTLSSIPEEAFSQTVSYVQNYVEKDYELRVTVVGNEVFACRIDSQKLDEDKGKIDWRQGYDYGLTHDVAHLPLELEHKCVAYLRQMGLRFGCFDFIATPKHEYIFLECNPNGQWLWIELLTGLKISESIARHLIMPEKLK